MSKHRVIGKHPALSASYGRSPSYPSAAEQRRRLRNARAKWIARAFLAEAVFALGYTIATDDFRALAFAAAGIFGFGFMCVFNFKHNEPGAR
jgi:hypothetical protein